MTVHGPNIYDPSATALSTIKPEAINHAKKILKKLDVRYSTKRVKLLALIYGDGSSHRHFSVDDLLTQTKQYGLSISLATLYNTIRVLVQKGYLGEIILPLGLRMFDTNLSDHQHYYNLHTHELYDVHFDIPIKDMLTPPEGMTIKNIKLTVSVEKTL